VSDLSSASVEPLLQGRLGRPYRFVAECESTQRLLDPNDAEGTTVATDLQTRGRGRLGRTWETPPGRGLLFSVLLHPRPPMALWPELSLVAGEAVAAALHAQTGVAAELSHPNDVLIEGRKVAGILAEASVGRVVLGIGVNVNQTADELPTETPKPATSLRSETGLEWPRASLLAAILLELERRYDDWQRLHTNR
jgi:BirA family biotin operon repressor/biotin-[acetyl-CoA-carboxylase] ligase